MKRAANRGLLALASVAFVATMPSHVAAFQPAGKAAHAPQLGDSKINPKDGLKYLWIPPGKYTEGCSTGDNDCYEDEVPQRKITLTKGFWLGDTEVTQAAFQKIMRK